MLDVAVLVKAVLVGALTAAAVMRSLTWGLIAGKSPRAQRVGAHWSWAIGAGVLAASGATDQWPHWPALEDRARFLTLLVPLTLLVETLAAAMRSSRLAWLVRLTLAAIVAPALLHNSVYLAVLPGRDTAEWSIAQATIILLGLAALLSLVWGALSALESRTSTTAVHWVLVLEALATAVTVMLSGYYRAGLLGLGLAGALMGATLSSYIGRSASSDTAQSPGRGSFGMGVIGIVSVVLMGRFFGNLPTGLAACLLLAPLLAWASELHPPSIFSPRWRAAVRLTCVGVPLIVALILAWQNFVAASAARSGPSAPNVVRDLAE